MRLRLVTAAEEQAWNDRQLAAPVRAPHLGLWAYRAPAVVLGASQRAQLARGAQPDATGMPVVARRTGGGAVLVGPGVLGVSVALPPDHRLVLPGIVSSYEWFGRAHVRALGRLGVACEAVRPDCVRSEPCSPSIAWACFGTLSPWEVVTLPQRRKLVGLAQRRARTGVLLVSGALVVQPDWDALCRALGRPSEDAQVLRERTSSCAQDISITDVADALAQELEEFSPPRR
ncbi:MAG: biotin/lipoate A/B protein ligase family protein [Candidatus Binatia bacterium]